MKRLMIRLGGTFLLLALVVSCGKADSKLIGIAKFVAHPALDAVEKGIIDEIAKSKPDYKLDLQNSNADMSTAAQIAQRFKQEKVTVAVGIATPTAQALANQIKNTPVVFSAVTDPVSAGLVPSMDKGGANVTGTSDMTPVRQQLDLLRTLHGNLKRLGHIYASGEANSVAIAKLCKPIAKKIRFNMSRRPFLIRLKSSRLCCQLQPESMGCTSAMTIPYFLRSMRLRRQRLRKICRW